MIFIFGITQLKTGTLAIFSEETNLCNNVIPISYATASGSKEGFPPSNVYDNDSSTRWTNKGFGSWIQVDLGKPQNICGIEITWYNGTTRIYNYILTTSVDGINFSNYTTDKSIGNISIPEKVSLNISNAKYIKLTVNGNNEGPYASISDIKMYGSIDVDSLQNVTDSSGSNKIVKISQSVSDTSFPTLNVVTDRIKYVEGQSVTILGSAIDQWGKPLKAPLTIKVQQFIENPTSTSKNDTILNSVTLCKNIHHCNPKMLASRQVPNIDVKKEDNEKSFSLFTVYSATLIPNGSYSIVLNKGLPPGKFNITGYIPYASAKAFNISNVGTLSTTLVKVQNWWESTPFLILAGGGTIGLIGLSVVLWRGTKEIKKINQVSHNDYMEFVFLTIIAFSPVTMLAVTDVALFPDSPVGIIIKPSVVIKSENVTQSVGEWMINIGGTSADKYKAGIQVPVAIFIFGILGGYLRYLISKTQSKKPPVRPKQKSDGKQVATERIVTVLRDLVLLFLSPLLAIAVWLVLFQGGTTSPLTLAAVSFAIGLATRQATEGLISFVERIFSPPPKTTS